LEQQVLLASVSSAEVDVEILDVTDDEARTLLLSIDPLAALAVTQTQLHQRLLELTPTDSAALEAAWQAAAEACLQAENDAKSAGFDGIPAQFLVLITCRDEEHQVELLSQFSGEGWSARRCCLKCDLRRVSSAPRRTTLDTGLPPADNPWIQVVSQARKAL
jgi:hypothetical protein